MSKKYSGAKSNSFNFKREFKNIQIGTVVSVGKVTINTDSEANRRRDERFNADRHAIRVRVVGSRYDNNIPDTELANCFPMLPKHLNVVPKEGEIVLVFVFGEDEKQSDRWYMGPFISSETKMDIDTIDTNALSHFSWGTSGPGEEISRIPLANGIYEEPKHVTIEGRNNTDIIQRDEEILIRAGKFINPKEFNDRNPSYIQLKYNHEFSDGENESSKLIGVTNIVSDKINLLTYPTGYVGNNTTEYDLTYREEDGEGAAKYISKDELNTILNEAHPLVFGDILVEYLNLFKQAFISHVHNPAGVPPTDKDGNPVANFIRKAQQLEKDMLSKNIRIN